MAIGNTANACDFELATPTHRSERHMVRGHDRHEQPVCSTQPEQPVCPTQPEQPVCPTQPEQPEQPTQPEQPVCPTQPEEPVVCPTEPEQPTQPEQPKPAEPSCHTDTTYSIRETHVPFVYAAIEHDASDRVTVRGQIIVPFGMKFATWNGKVAKTEDVRMIPGAKVLVKAAKNLSVTGAADFYVGEDKIRKDLAGGISVNVSKAVALEAAYHGGDLGHGATVGFTTHF
ncbi:MAG: hypothetical protein HGB18_00060 [Candidatus Moranbacteria bacterium]|nr:hypothetical protein [Candidatus Moranbacteria bacterium]